MSSSIEDRLRAHYADRAARETLPGPEGDTTLQQAREGVVDGAPPISLTHRPERRRRPDRRTWLAVAAAVALVAGIAGAVAAVSDDGPSDVSTNPDPAPTTTVPRPEPTTSSTSTTTTTTEATDPGVSLGDTVADPPPTGAAPTGPFVAAEGMLGSWSGTAWVPWDVGTTPPSGDEYQVVGLDQAITTAVGRPGTDCTPEGNPIVDLGLSAADKLDPVPIGVGGVADPRPRGVEVLAPSAYRDATVEFLASRGIDDPNPKVSQAVRSDIDGDGTAEVVVVAERISDPVSWYAAAGDYSVVFLRHLVGGQIRTSEIALWSAGPSPEQSSTNVVHRVEAVADLNGDGRMEIVVGAHLWESSSTAVHELRPDGTLPEVLSVGCGV